MSLAGDALPLPLAEPWFFEDLWPELSHLVDALVALHSGWAWHEVAWSLSAWEIWAGMRVAVKGLEGRM